MKLSKRFEDAMYFRAHVLVTLTSKGAQRHGHKELHIPGFLSRVGKRPDQVFIADDLATNVLAPQGHLLRISDIADWHPIPVILTEEDMKRMAPILQRTWDSIAPDAEEHVSGVDGIIEMTVDAGRPCECGMSGADYQLLCRAYNRPDTQAWLRRVLNYSTNNYPRDDHRPHAPCRG